MRYRSRHDGAIALVVALLWAPIASAAQTHAEPSFMHGAGQLLRGLIIELPKTVLDATLTGPPVVGTAVGLLAGVARAVQATVAGLVEMSAGFDPFEAKRPYRR
jgi:hypothetical protein